ncbi:hypothetical protein Q8A67_000162 [Cirrhinus molitorella]|uniref:Uncharacterized protein n=1 Tax=Cirrhinus molitorella TaxID=172907 RepID=A0AA88TXG6_9TELE|nr:hypothetical protein Q8A67_000162 [Cirrhinus molitorella]
MEFIKEETEDVKIEETFRVKHEETEEQIDLMPLKEECKELNEVEKKEEYETHYKAPYGSGAGMDRVIVDFFGCLWVRYGGKKPLPLITNLH